MPITTTKCNLTNSTACSDGKGAARWCKPGGDLRHMVAGARYAMFLAACTLAIIWSGPKNGQHDIASDTAASSRLPAVMPARA